MTEEARERARALREEGLTHREIADVLGVSESRVGQYLRPRRSPEELDALRAEIRARAVELRAEGHPLYSPIPEMSARRRTLSTRT